MVAFVENLFFSASRLSGAIRAYVSGRFVCGCGYPLLPEVLERKSATMRRKVAYPKEVRVALRHKADAARDAGAMEKCKP
jgi:hypothetical protein